MRRVALGGKGEYILTTYDVLATPEQKVSLCARLQAGVLVLTTAVVADLNLGVLRANINGVYSKGLPALHWAA